MKNILLIYCTVIFLLLAGLALENDIQSRNTISLTGSLCSKKNIPGENTSRMVDLSKVNTWLCVYSNTNTEDIIKTDVPGLT